MPALTPTLFLPPHAGALQTMRNITGFVPSKEQFPHSSIYSLFSEAILFSFLILVSVHRGFRLSTPVCIENVVIYLVQWCCAMLPHYPPKNLLEKLLPRLGMGRCHYIIWKTTLWNGQEGSESRTAIVSPVRLRQKTPNEFFGEGPCREPSPCPVQGTSSTSATAVGGFGMSFLMLEGAVDRGSSTQLLPTAVAQSSGW